MIKLDIRNKPSKFIKNIRTKSVLVAIFIRFSFGLLVPPWIQQGCLIRHWYTLTVCSTLNPPWLSALEFSLVVCYTINSPWLSMPSRISHGYLLLLYFILVICSHYDSPWLSVPPTTFKLNCLFLLEFTLVVCSS